MSDLSADPVPTLAERLRAVQGRIAAAAKAAGRQAEGITLVAVSKTHGAEVVAEAIACGQHRFGENRVQEAAGKFPALRGTDESLRLHLIGALQTNKVRDAVRIADVIESLDRASLADAIEREAERGGRLPTLLVQVNVGDEAQKAGVPWAEADAFVADCMRRFGPGVAGLMCIPPVGHDPRPMFAALRALAGRHGLAVLSMGMSDDLEAAVTEGATEVRVGSAIFGARPQVR